MNEPAARTLERAPVRGLTSSEAAQRLQQFGVNKIARGPAVSPVRLLAAQFNSPVIWLLFGACVVSAALGELADAIAIGAIIINGFVGFFQGRRYDFGPSATRHPSHSGHTGAL